jgi:pSer/pThr/pTyr-binding forkhead associated (FHA) protein
MAARLVALDDGPDIPLDRAMVVVGRHPLCDARLDSLRISRHHCCMMQDKGELFVRDLGSTNGIRINGQRVEMGRLRPGDELSIAHIRFRLEDGQGHEQTILDRGDQRTVVPSSGRLNAPPSSVRAVESPSAAPEAPQAPAAAAAMDDNGLAAAVRGLLPSALADRCRIQVIVQPLPEDASDAAQGSNACRPDSSP